jgi:GTP cyclohydrolase II
MEKSGKPLYYEVTPNPYGQPYRPGDWRNIAEIEHTDEKIKGFFGDYRFLSNFSKANIELDGVTYRSTECAYQAAKWKPENRDYFVNCSNEEAITYNHQHEPNGFSPEAWDEMKLEVMHYLIEQKFDKQLNPENYSRLLETGDKYLEETNWWNDTFWGKNLKNEGQNYLGILLMITRDKLKHQDQTPNN